MNNERNEQKNFSNHNYQQRMSASYTANSGPPFMSNSVPFQSIFQASYYLAQCMNMGIGLPYPRQNSTGNIDQQTPLHKNYSNIPPYHYNSRAPHSVNYTNEDSNNSQHLRVSTYSNQNYQQTYDDLVSGETNSSSVKSKKLQPTAKEFEPRELRKENCISNNSSGNNLSVSKINNSIGEKSESISVNNRNNKSNISTRPKEFNPQNRQYSTSGKNWERGNKSYDNQNTLYNSDFSSSDSHKQSFVKNNAYNSRYKRTQKNFQDESSQFLKQSYNHKSKNTPNEQNSYYNNQDGFNQRKANHGARKGEWRHSNDFNYDYYSYKGVGVENYSNNWNRGGGHRYPGNNYHTYPNVQQDMKQYPKNRQYVNNCNQRGKKKEASSYSRSNATYSQRKDNNQHSEDVFNHQKTSKNQADDDKKMIEFQLLNTEDEKTQRENLIENLSKGLYECMVCCEVIRQQHSIWSCNKCYNCFHFVCTKKWAQTSQTGEPGWRCPTCQNLNSKIPNGYFCFCKKMREPEWNRREIPHSCGEVCGKKRENEWCTHKCILLCHPGPCPDCTAFIKRTCQCGKNAREMKCSQVEPYLCEGQCGRSLNCGIHFCEKLCHVGECDSCTVIKEEECFCQKEKRSSECNSETANRKSFSCGSTCGKLLSCEHHSCQQICHDGPCKPCDRAVDAVTTCPCGKMSLDSAEVRESCLDPIPTCGKLCNKTHSCGNPGNYHVCKNECHEGPCPPCQDNTPVRCRCGFMNKNIPCSELLSKADEVTCEKQCKKFRHCGRHKCGMKCCIEIDHICSKICGRNLICRLHKCQESCHRGNCPRCWETSFEELTCHCGASVTYPPVPCGTEPPACQLPCRRAQPCSHPVSHNCHADPHCPPCTTLVSKPCFGEHTMMKSTPCYVKAMSCGDQCAKRLPCGIHKCQNVCHDGPCIKGAKCNQNCTEIRESCDHPCNSPCHSGPCPNSPCKQTVTVTCICGNRKVKMVCSENDREYKSMATSRLASELHNLNSGGSVNISQIFSGSSKAERTKRLECNEECNLIERNRQLALALQIENPDAREMLGETKTALFTDFIKDEARKDLQFAQTVHSALNDLVMKAKQSKQKSRSHSFPPMNRDKRRFIHEYSKFFGCQSESYDEEPKKNVVVTACKALCRLPPTSVVTVIQRKQGQRKVPEPVLSRKGLASDEGRETWMRRLEKGGFDRHKETTDDASAKISVTKAPVIDYFDVS